MAINGSHAVKNTNICVAVVAVVAVVNVVGADIYNDILTAIMLYNQIPVPVGRRFVMMFSYFAFAAAEVVPKHVLAADEIVAFST